MDTERIEGLLEQIAMALKNIEKKLGLSGPIALELARVGQHLEGLDINLGKLAKPPLMAPAPPHKL